MRTLVNIVQLLLYREHYFAAFFYRRLKKSLNNIPMTINKQLKLMVRVTENLRWVANLESRLFDKRERELGGTK